MKKKQKRQKRPTKAVPWNDAETLLRATPKELDRLFKLDPETKRLLMEFDRIIGT